MKPLFAILALPMLAAAQTTSDRPVDKLRFLIGDWEAHYKQTGADGKSESVTSTVKSRLVLDGQMVQMEETQKVEGKEPSSSLILFTFDADAKLYRAFVYTSGLPWTQLSLSGKLEGDKLSLSDEMGPEAGATFGYERLDDGKYRFTSVLKNGAATFRDQADYSKAKSK